jgi:hypothetical protein
VATLPSGESITVYFDPDSKLIAGFDATRPPSQCSEMRRRSMCSPTTKKDVGGLKLPHRITIRKLGQPYSEVQYASVAVNEGEPMRRLAFQRLRTTTS